MCDKVQYEAETAKDFVGDRKCCQGDECNVRKDLYGSVNVVTKVGKPFIPEFELIFSELNSTSCPDVKSVKTLTGLLLSSLTLHFKSKSFA